MMAYFLYACEKAASQQLKECLMVLLQGARLPFLSSPIPAPPPGLRRAPKGPGWLAFGDVHPNGEGQPRFTLRRQ